MEEQKNYIIYSYEFEKDVYVGLTKDMKRRDREHRGIAYKKKDSLKNYSVEHNVEIPQPRVLETNLTETESVLKEDNWLKFYRDNGYGIINVGKTGLNHGSLGNTAVQRREKPEKRLKMEMIDEKLKDGTLTDDEAVSCFWRFSTKTQMSKEYGSLYTFCRERGLLDRFPKKKKPESLNLSFSGTIEIGDEKKLVEVERAPGFFLDVENGVAVRKYKRHFKKLAMLEDDEGYLKCRVRFGQQVKEVYYHNLLASCLGIRKKFTVSYRDGDRKNVRADNIVFGGIEFDTASTFNGNIILTDGGTIIDRRKNTVVTPEKTEDGLYFDGIEIGLMVYNYFKKRVDLKYGRIVHLDGDVFNNHLDNLFLPGDDIVKMEPNSKGTYTVYIDNGNGRTLVGNFSHRRHATEARDVLSVEIKRNPYWSQWYDDVKTKKIDPIIEDDREKTKYEMRVESSGCYWFEPRKCWKSKIYYKGKERSLGYFNDFESGKLMYELASLYIKYGKFERWFKDIEYERKYAE